MAALEFRAKPFKIEPGHDFVLHSSVFDKFAKAVKVEGEASWYLSWKADYITDALIFGDTSLSTAEEFIGEWNEYHPTTDIRIIKLGPSTHEQLPENSKTE